MSAAGCWCCVHEIIIKVWVAARTPTVLQQAHTHMQAIATGHLTRAWPHSRASATGRRGQHTPLPLTYAHVHTRAADGRVHSSGPC